VSLDKFKKDVGITDRLTLDLPEVFLQFCAENLISPALILEGFIGDLCYCTGEKGPDGTLYATNGSDERMLAEQYYNRCCYNFTTAHRKEELAALLEPLVLTAMEEIDEDDGELVYTKGELGWIVEDCFSNAFGMLGQFTDTQMFYDVSETVCAKVKESEQYKALPEG